MIVKAAIVAYIASRLLCTRHRVYVSPPELIVTRLVVGRDATEATAGPGRREGPRSAGKRAQPAEQAAATKLCKEKVGKRNFTAAYTSK